MDTHRELESNFNHSIQINERKSAVITGVKKLENFDTCNVDFTLDDLVYNFDYNGTNGSDGSVQEFTAPVSGKYVLEVWGAQGGTASSTYIGGYGGYSTGIVSLTKGEKLYIVVGGKGTNNSTL